MIRISSGKAKNIQLNTPNIPGYRGVQEVAKQALFNILEDEIKDKVCLDLYAGSGNIGIEALSRGAKICDFVDENKKAVKVIEENLEKTGFSDCGEVIRSDAVKYVANTPEKYDVIFADPYYENISHIHLFKNLEEILKPDGVIAFFHSKNLDWEKTLKDTNFEIKDQRRFGISFFTLITHLTN
ncbi:16S rRNA (guanine(966)-N(2))-methyltransferase RsmD [Patescibacteria group bacterium]|nr:16S rRNA (guanine(966)-N(2))-methyltransferase RsmD [Patescibacteria group bacterium]